MRRDTSGAPRDGGGRGGGVATATGASGEEGESDLTALNRAVEWLGLDRLNSSAGAPAPISGL